MKRICIFSEIVVRFPVIYSRINNPMHPFFRTITPIFFAGLLFSLPQSASATYSIADKDGGYDCEGKEIGTWDKNSKTCTLSKDLDEGIFLSNNITLDGDDHTITGDEKGDGIQSKDTKNITVQNVTIKNFGTGADFARVSNIEVSHVHAEKNTYAGFVFFLPNNLSFNDFTANNNEAGVIMTRGDSLEVTQGEMIGNNTYGLSISTLTHLTLKDTTLEDNGSGFAFKGDLEDSDTLTTHDIDDSNTADGKVIYYLSGASDKDLGSETGALICIDCTNVHVKKATFAPSDTPALFYRSKDVSVKDSAFPGGVQEIYLVQTDGAEIRGNTFDDDSPYSNTGVLIAEESKNVTVAENTFSGMSTAVSSKDSSGVHAEDNALSGVLIDFSFDNSSDAIISRNFADQDTDSYGVTLSKSPGAVIEKNTFPNARYGGIKAEDSDQLTIIGNNIDNYYGSPDHPRWGVSVIGSKGSIIQENTFGGGHIPLNFGNLKDSVVRGNTMPESTRFGIYLSDSENNTFERNSIHTNGSSDSVFLYQSSRNTFSENTFDSESKYANSILLTASPENTFTRNNILFPQNTIGISAESTGNIFSGNGRGNHYQFYDEEKEGCGDTNGDGICDAPLEFHVGTDPNAPVIATDFGPYTTENGWEDNGPKVSSVVFLPGMQASELWERSQGESDQKRWINLLLPSTNASRLQMNDDGTGKNDIYVGSIIESVATVNLYEQFFNKLDEFKASGTIFDWKWISYDWRLNSQDIVAQDIKFETEVENILDTVETMAHNSPTKKVTLIGHSKGGTVAKIIAKKLEERGEANILDKMIFVGTPQLGTPETLLGMLHGEEINIPYILNKETARKVSERMPNAYELLPTKRYFDTVFDPIITFDDKVNGIYNFKQFYGDSIDTYDEMQSFLLGDDGIRKEPADSDLDTPNVLSENIMDKTEPVRDSTVNWIAPEGVKVYEIAGWGLDTFATLKYEGCTSCLNLSDLKKKLTFTSDGDGTVVLPSAVATSGEKYYVNIHESNKIYTNREHFDMMEVPSIQSLVQNILTDSDEIPEYVSKTIPNPDPDDKRFRLTMHSPVDVHLIDAEGRHTGITNRTDGGVFYEANIPNSYYRELGDEKYLGVDDRNTTIDLEGAGTGTFTFSIDTVEGDTITDTTTFENIPVTPNMKGTLSINGETGSGDLTLDIDGDGNTDETIGAKEALTKAQAAKIARETAQQMAFKKDLAKRFVLQSFALAERWYDHGGRLGERFGDRRLKLLKHHVKIFKRFHWIDTETKDQLTIMIVNILQMER